MITLFSLLSLLFLENEAKSRVRQEERDKYYEAEAATSTTRATTTLLAHNKQCLSSLHFHGVQ